MKNLSVEIVSYSKDRCVLLQEHIVGNYDTISIEKQSSDETGESGSILFSGTTGQHHAFYAMFLPDLEFDSPTLILEDYWGKVRFTFPNQYTEVLAMLKLLYGEQGTDISIISGEYIFIPDYAIEHIKDLLQKLKLPEKILATIL